MRQQWVRLESIVLREMIQACKYTHTHHTTLLTQNIRCGKFTEKETEIGVTGDGKVGNEEVLFDE